MCNDFQFSHTFTRRIIWRDFITVAIGLMSRVFANDSGDQDSIPGRIIQKTQKMVLDAALLNTQHYKVRIKDKVEQSICIIIHFVYVE